MVKEFAMPEIFNSRTGSAPDIRPAREHTHWQSLLFFAKAWVFRTQRMFDNFCDGSITSYSAAPPSGSQNGRAFESRSLLYTSDAAVEFTLQVGKVQNLRIAAACLNGVVIPAGETFSFWEHVGRPVRSRGFVEGRELREGCVIPSVGGGLCQLSNALYDAALSAGCEIVERHAHSRKLPGSMAIADRDATVFWNYVDLRFRAPSHCRLEVQLTQRELIVRLVMLDGTGRSIPTARHGHPKPAESAAEPRARAASDLHPVESCETCEMTHCFRHTACQQLTAEGCTAWLVDAWQPEFDRYLQAQRKPEDWLLLPLDGRRWSLGSYRWNTEGFSRTKQAWWETLTRSFQSRRLASQGAERQKALLRFDETLARRFAHSVPASATHLVISLNLLPFLWRDGVLGGRTFDVLMTRQPIASLQSTLDLAHQRHPASPTLADFRVSPELMEAESGALAEARHWITPHRAIAELGGKRSVLLDWELPQAQPKTRAKSRIVFPASTLGRKGAYELREVAQRLGLTVVLGGRVIEDPHFWAGVEVERAGEDWLANVEAVVLPAWVEHQPRRLLQAVAAGVPVIASNACGLEGVPGVTTISEGDVAALEAALRKVVER